MNLQQLRGATRDRLDDWAQPFGWSDAEINAWINEAVQEASLRAGLNVEVVSVATRPNIAKLQLPDVLAFIHEVRWIATPIDLMSRWRVLARFNQRALVSDWTDNPIIVGDPARYTVEGRYFWLYPMPEVAGRLEFRANVYPPPLERDSDEPDLPPALHRHLLEWVIYRAGQKRDEDYMLPNPEQYEINFARVFGSRAGAATQQAWLQYGGTSTASSCERRSLF